MKVNIGKYNKYFGPYQIAEAILFWIPKYTKTYDYNPAYEKYVEGFGDILAKTPLNNLCQWIDSKKKRKVEIKIHDYDSWNADHTMALIILPVLQELKKQKHGAGMIDDEDVPWYLRSTMYTKENEFDSDGNTFPRYEWVLDEMIWTFQQIVDQNWEERYYHGKCDVSFETCDNNSKLKELKRGPNYTFWVDNEGLNNHQKCIDNGLRLFGKYFQTLWD